MHLNSYIVSKDPKKTLGEIIEYIKQGVDPQRNLINSWEVRLDTRRIIEDGNYNEPYTVLLINKEKNSNEKTCLSLHAYVGSDDECQIGQRFIVCTPHFWTTYIEKHSYSYSELEDFLKDFDQFIQTHFYTLYEEYTTDPPRVLVKNNTI